MIKHLVLFAFIAVCFLPRAHAGKVVNVKGKKVYIVFDANEGGTFAEGDTFTLTDASGKKKALVQIKKVKGLKAIAQLKKGKAGKGFGTVFRSASKPGGSLADSSEETSSSSSSSGGYNRMQSHWGAMFGYGVASQDVDQGNSVSAQTGSSMAIKGAYDYPLLSSVAFRALAGFELFSVSGMGEPLNSTAQATVGTDITYLSLDGLIKWTFIDGKSFGFYVLGGVGFLYPMTKSSDVIVEDSIESLAVAEFGGGFEYKWGKWVVPVDVTYYYFPSGEDVTTGLISIKVGLLF